MTTQAASETRNSIIPQQVHNKHSTTERVITIALLIIGAEGVILGLAALVGTPQLSNLLGRAGSLAMAGGGTGCLLIAVMLLTYRTHPNENREQSAPDDTTPTQTSHTDLRHSPREQNPEKDRSSPPRLLSPIIGSKPASPSSSLRGSASSHEEDVLKGPDILLSALPAVDVAEDDDTHFLYRPVLDTGSDIQGSLIFNLDPADDIPLYPYPESKRRIDIHKEAGANRFFLEGTTLYYQQQFDQKAATFDPHNGAITFCKKFYIDYLKHHCFAPPPYINIYNEPHPNNFFLEGNTVFYREVRKIKIGKFPTSGTSVLYDTICHILDPQDQKEATAYSRAHLKPIQLQSDFADLDSAWSALMEQVDGIDNQWTFFSTADGTYYLVFIRQNSVRYNELLFSSDKNWRIDGESHGGAIHIKYGNTTFGTISPEGKLSTAMHGLYLFQNAMDDREFASKGVNEEVIQPPSFENSTEARTKMSDGVAKQRAKSEYYVKWEGKFAVIPLTEVMFVPPSYQDFMDQYDSNGSVTNDNQKSQSRWSGYIFEGPDGRHEIPFCKGKAAAILQIIEQESPGRICYLAS